MYKSKINYKRDDLIPYQRFAIKSQKRTLPCSNCGEYLPKRSPSSHTCNQIPECHFCFTQVPAKYLMHHVQQCQILAEAKLMLINLENIQTTSNSQASQPEIFRGLDNDGVSSQELNTSRNSSSSTDSKQKMTSSSDEISKNYSQNRLKYIRKSRKRSFGQGLEQILEEDRSFQKNLNESKRPCLRSESKFSNEPVSSDSSLDNDNAEVLKKKLRKSNEYKHLSTDIKPFIKFFKQAANQNEKRLLLAALLPDELTENDLTHFSSLFHVKRDYVQEVHNERLLKVALGHEYPIEVLRSNKGQVRVSPEIKSAIIKAVDDASQYWPGIAESIHLKCSSVTDDSLKSFYTKEARIVQKRSVDHYQMSRKVLPVRYIDFFNEEIKPKYPTVSFHQFLSLVPYHVFPVNIGWSHS